MIRESPAREEVLRGFWPSEGALMSTLLSPATASLDAARGKPHAATATAPVTLDATLATLRARGLRASSARRLVLQALLEAARPITAERIANGLGGQITPSDLGSVYRNLETLERAGVVRHLHAAHGAGLYAIARDEDQGFLACERCGEVQPANPRAVTVIRHAVRKAFGYDASFLHFPIVGICPDCAQSGTQQ
jgi:Fur family transcriptional regulator, ferric uptake regulator